VASDEANEGNLYRGAGLHQISNVLNAYNALVLELIQYWHQAEQERVVRSQAQAAMIANGFHEAGESIRQSAQTPISQPQVNIPQMPREYVRRNAITGQLETVTEYGNGIQGVWPVGQ
jgi:hypothetical protein